MINGSYDQLAELVRRNVCGGCGGEIVVAWYSAEKTYVIRCGEGHYPEQLTRQLSPTQAYKAGEPLPIVIKDNIEKRRRQTEVNNTTKGVDQKTTLLPGYDLATGEALSLETINNLIAYAIKYSLDIYRGHVVLMYGQPYITIDGYLWHAKREGKPYTMSSKPMTVADRKLYMIPEGAHAWLCEILLNEGKSKVTGVGIVTSQEMTEESKKKPGQLRSPVVAAHPWQLAQKRAEWQALRRAFPIAAEEQLPKVEESKR
jgi:hypothetical protein